MKSFGEASMEQTVLAQALARQDWGGAARYLLVGVARTLEKVPADSLEGLLDILGWGKGGARKGGRETCGKKRV